MTLYIGLMSGTSMDGIDAALVEIPSNKLLCGLTKKYSIELRLLIENLISGEHLTLASVCQLNTLIGREFAGAVVDLLEKAKISASEVSAIGSHGQTVCHDTIPSIPYTLQLGCGHTISSLTGVTVVADFRTRDIVNGGQGAPFAPIYHHELFSRLNADVSVVNIGGISNITFISPFDLTKGWDVGPGNCLMDAWIYKHLGKNFDCDGSWAKQGVLIRPLLEDLLADPFFAKIPPKSIGKEYFSLSWLAGYLKNDYKAVDVQATLLQLTARSIAETVLNTQRDLKQLYLCGGGTHNKMLHDALSLLLTGISVTSIAAAGYDPDYLEAMMIAWLAAQTVNNSPIDLTSITGSKRPAVLGAVYPIG